MPTRLARRPEQRRFVVVTGLSGSGKTTLARQVGPMLGLTVLDKDDILERFFETHGVRDREWRRGLSRTSDEVFAAEAAASEGAMLVSFWRLPGMGSDTGTPAAWLYGLQGQFVALRCKCAPEIAAARFVSRRRHRGHLIPPHRCQGRTPWSQRTSTARLRGPRFIRDTAPNRFQRSG